MKWVSDQTWIVTFIVLSMLIHLFCMSSTDLLVEEAYYWNYAQHLDWGYLDHPPVIALLIKLSTASFGNSEFSIRIPALLCWLGAGFWSYQLSNLLKPKCGIYALLFLAILPFFFLQSLFMTPDLPLLVCWSAALYYLYRALVLKDSKCWYMAGLWIGLGLDSKYTIVLLGLSIVVYLIGVSSARFWFRRKEPYIAAVIALVLFSPVIYWNATHEWISFTFQSTRRFKGNFEFFFPQFLALFALFMMPVGLWSLWKLSFQKENTAQSFFLLFTLVPLVFFGLYSLSHGLRFNWIGPGLLALIPWMAMEFAKAIQCENRLIVKGWFTNAALLLMVYSFMVSAISLGSPEILNRQLLKKYIAWGDLILELNALSSHIEAKTHSTPIFVPLDIYNLSSELNYYQTKFLERGIIKNAYPIIGGHIFGFESMMYRYWEPMTDLSGKTLILLSMSLTDFSHFKPTLTPHAIWPHSQSALFPMKPLYYAALRGRVEEPPKFLEMSGHILD